LVYYEDFLFLILGRSVSFFAMSFTIVPSPHSPPHLSERWGGVAGEGRGTNGFLWPFLASLRIIVRSLTPKNKAHSAERSIDVSLPLFVHTTRRVVWKTWGLVPPCNPSLKEGGEINSRLRQGGTKTFRPSQPPPHTRVGWGVGKGETFIESKTARTH
jgi:hypothetical protein